MNFIMNILKAVGKVVDAAVPVATGARTKIAVVACPILASPVVPAILNAIPGAGSLVALVAPLQAVLCTAAPLFALAGLVRDK